MSCRATAFLLACLAVLPVAAAEPVGLAVTPAGQVTLTLAGRPVATGRWGLRPDSYVPATIGPAPFNPGPILAATATQDTPTHATVHERHAAVTADYTLDLAGEDLTIAAHVANADPAHAVRPLAFNGITFHFDPASHVAGQMNAWHWTYLLAQGVALLHPSVQSPLGCWWANDDHFGFSAFSESEFDRPALVAATCTNREQTLSPECGPDFYTDRGVPPGGAVDVTLTIRITADRSLAHLIGGYKAVYDRHFPRLAYTPVDRPLAAFSEVDSAHVTRRNPLGYHADWCRFDTAWGVAAYARRYAPAEQRDGYLGMLFWSPGGYDPPMYPPDFDVLPPAVQANLPALVDGFHARGLRVGLCARPGDGVRRPPDGPPTVYRLSPDDPEQMRVEMDRFRHAMAMGFDMFYLDSIGGSGTDDVRIIRLIRQTVGPAVLLYSEYSTDMSLPLAGRYCEWTPNGTIQWDGPETYAALRLLCPQSTWLCVSRTRETIPPDFARLGLIPLIADQALAHARPWAPPPVPPVK